MVLLLLEHGALTLQDLWLLHWRRLLLEGTLALLRLVLLLEGTLALLFLPLLELLLDLLLLLRLTVAVRFVLLSTPCRLPLHTYLLG